jgi:hypothetical protein
LKALAFKFLKIDPHVRLSFVVPGTLSIAPAPIVPVKGHVLRIEVALWESIAVFFLLLQHPATAAFNRSSMKNSSSSSNSRYTSQQL